MPVWIAFLLGIVQGLTEFLPISSSGHLALMQNLFQIEQYTANHIAFDITLHLGTLFAAIIAFPSSWRHKIVGFLVGFLAIQALNVVRVISLFYLGQWNMAVFNFAHEFLWQALIMLDVLIVWPLWVRAGSKERAANEPPPPDEPPAPPVVTTAPRMGHGEGTVSHSLDLSPHARPRPSV